MLIYDHHPEPIVDFLVYSWYYIFCAFEPVYNTHMGFPHGASGKEPACHCSRCKRHEFDPWVRKIPLEEGMTTYSSVLAWRIPWTEEPGRLQSMGLQTVRLD